MKQRIVDEKVQNIFELHDHTPRMEPRVDHGHSTKARKKSNIPLFHYPNTPLMNTLMNLYKF